MKKLNWDEVMISTLTKSGQWHAASTSNIHTMIHSRMSKRDEYVFVINKRQKAEA